MKNKKTSSIASLNLFKTASSRHCVDALVRRGGFCPQPWEAKSVKQTGLCGGVESSPWQSGANCEVSRSFGAGARRIWQLEAAARPGAVAVRPLELVVSTNWRDLDMEEVRALLTATEQNCEQFPRLDAEGAVLEVDVRKLKRAIKHSAVVVSISMRGELEDDYYVGRPVKDLVEKPWLGKKRTLVAFGRATSDRSLTAAIHDVAVAPSLQRQGLGRRLVDRIVREIVRYGICDISVMSDAQTRPFFRSCGFCSDVLGSTSMMYTAANDTITTLLLPSPFQES